jgi:NitT/TauT family transport system substrate-binding protein
MNDMASAIPSSGPLSRRQFLQVAGGLGLSAAGLALLEACGANPASPTAAADKLETTTIRIPLGGTGGVSTCVAPLFVAEDFLKAEGFTDVQYVKSATPITIVAALAAGAGDMSMQFSGPSILNVDAGKPIIMLAGIHVGCFVLFGSAAITNISDLKGKTVGIAQLGGPDHVFMSSILANVGLNPNTDITWTIRPVAETKQLFTDGKIDAILAFPPAAQELRAKNIGHVVVNSMMDAPWSQYFCCMATFNRDFVQKNPVATKRALRALLKATDVTALHPEQAARLMVDKGFTPNYDYALQAMKDIPYNRWRQYNPEETIRFYSLLLHGVGMVKNTPEAIIKQGTDWHFLNELKTEMPTAPTPQATPG